MHVVVYVRVYVYIANYIFDILRMFLLGGCVNLFSFRRFSPGSGVPWGEEE